MSASSRRVKTDNSVDNHSSITNVWPGGVSVATVGLLVLSRVPGLSLLSVTLEEPWEGNVITITPLNYTIPELTVGPPPPPPPPPSL